MHVCVQVKLVCWLEQFLTVVQSLRVLAMPLPARSPTFRGGSKRIGSTQYWLFKSVPQKVGHFRWTGKGKASRRTPNGRKKGWFVVDWVVRRKLASGGWGMRLVPYVVEKDGRLDLKVNLGPGGYQFFHRVLALVLKRTWFDKAGRRVKSPFWVKAANWGWYEGDHVNFNVLDCRLCNLEPVQVDRHRGERRDGWNRTSLTLEESVAKLEDLC